MSEEQTKNVGIAISLIILIFMRFKNDYQMLWLVLLLLCLCLFCPFLLRLILAPVSALFSKIIGPGVFKIFLISCYYGIITPIGFLRKRKGIDPLQLKKWKVNNPSSFSARGRMIKENDFENPY